MVYLTRTCRWSTLGALALLGSLAGCGSTPVSPGASGESATSLTAAGHRASETPSVREVQIAPRGGEIAIGLQLEASPGHDRLPLDPRPSTGSSWFFVLTLDPDQTRSTGIDTGHDFELIPISASELVAREVGQTTSIGSIPYTTKTNRVEFRVPREWLANDDGLMDFTLDVYQVEIVGGEREVEHASTFQGTNHPVATIGSQVPVMTDLRTEVRNGVLVLRGQFKPRDQLAAVFYSANQPGGWQLQLFVNADRQSSGYWNGYDFVVRGGEWQNGAVIVRTTENDDTNPGGWGPACGTANLDLSSRHFSLELPLASIGGDDGDLEYALETYATVSCADCAGGTTAAYLDDYFGASGERQRMHLLAADLRPVESARPGVRRLLARGSLSRGSDADF